MITRAVGHVQIVKHDELLELKSPMPDSVAAVWSFKKNNEEARRIRTVPERKQKITRNISSSEAKAV
jgi:hypothetical protein